MRTGSRTNNALLAFGFLRSKREDHTDAQQFIRREGTVGDAQDKTLALGVPQFLEVRSEDGDPVELCGRCTGHGRRTQFCKASGQAPLGVCPP